MVSLIFVSHSNELAKATSKYIKEITKSKTSIAFCGGIGAGKKEFGTDPIDILNTIEDVYSEDGVIIFCDMGSALISSQLSISMLDENKQQNVKITSAPFVEGGVIASIQASLNKKINDIILESLESLSGKKSYVEYEKDLQNNQNSNNENYENLLKDYKKNEYKIILTNGLHARPVFQLINIITNSKSSVYISNKTKNKCPIKADNITKITLLNIEHNDIMDVYAKGPDTDEVFSKIQELINKESISDNKIYCQNKINSKFQIICDGNNDNIRGIGKYININFNVEKQIVENTELEKEKLSNAIEKVKEDIIEQKAIIEKELTNDEYLIFETHLSILLDESLIEEVNNSIENNKYSAAYSYYLEMNKYFQSFEELEDGYIKERKYDIKDILYQVLKYLLNCNIEIPKDNNIILIFDEMYASIVPKISHNIKGVISKNGSPLSHASILLKSINMPYIIYEDALKLIDKELYVDIKNFNINFI